MQENSIESLYMTRLLDQREILVKELIDMDASNMQAMQKQTTITAEIYNIDAQLTAFFTRNSSESNLKPVKTK